MLPILKGKKVTLRQLTEADAPSRARWTADEELAELMGADLSGEAFVSMPDEIEGNREHIRERVASGILFYALEAEGRYIGDIDIKLIPNERRAEMIFFIGEKDARGKGFGTEAVGLVLEWLLANRAVDYVDIEIAPANRAAVQFWKKLGFRELATVDSGGIVFRYGK